MDKYVSGQTAAAQVVTALLEAGLKLDPATKALTQRMNKASDALDAFRRRPSMRSAMQTGRMSPAQSKQFDKLYSNWYKLRKEWETSYPAGTSFTEKTRLTR